MNQKDMDNNDLMERLVKSHGPEIAAKGKIELEKMVATSFKDMMITDTRLNGREAVTGFVTWLTTRDVSITMSAKHGAAEPCDLVNQFCNVNKLPECRDEWTEYLTHPEN